MEHKFGNMQIGFDILSTLVLRDHSKWTANKNEHGKGDNACPSFRSKSNQKGKKNFNPSWNHWSQGRTNESVITEVCEESKLWIYFIGTYSGYVSY